MSFRLPYELHLPCKESADKQGQTLAEWIRRAMQEKLEREKVSVSDNAAKLIPDIQLQNLISKIVSDQLEQRGLAAGTVHGLAFAEPDGKKFEKVMLKQKSY